MIIYDVKPSLAEQGGLEGINPAIWYGPIGWAIFGITVAVMGRRPIVTGARADRAGDEDDPSTVHDNGLALDLRANDRGAETRQRYANLLRRWLTPFGLEVIGPYPLPNGHIHIEVDWTVMQRAGYVGAMALAVLLIVRVV